LIPRYDRWSADISQRNDTAQLTIDPPSPAEGTAVLCYAACVVIATGDASKGRRVSDQREFGATFARRRRAELAVPVPPPAVCSAHGIEPADVATPARDLHKPSAAVGDTLRMVCREIDVVDPPPTEQFMARGQGAGVVIPSGDVNCRVRQRYCLGRAGTWCRLRLRMMRSAFNEDATGVRPRRAQGIVGSQTPAEELTYGRDATRVRATRAEFREDERGGNWRRLHLGARTRSA